MIVIQNFPSVAALVGWLHNARVACGRRDFAKWLSGYMSHRELVVHDRQYFYWDCIDLLRMEDAQNVG